MWNFIYKILSECSLNLKIELLSLEIRLTTENQNWVVLKDLDDTAIA